MKNQFVLFFFIFIVFFSNYSFGQTNIPQEEYNCIANIIVKANLTTYYPKDGDGIYSNICTKSKCYSNGSIETVSLNGRNEKVPMGLKLAVSDLTCFPYATRFNIYSIQIEEEILYYQFPSLKTLTLLDILSLSTINKTIPPLDFLQIISGISITLYLSSIVNVQQLQFYGSTSQINHKIIRDTISVTPKLTSLDAFIDNFPNLDNFYFRLLSFAFSSTYDGSDFSNYQYVKGSEIKLSTFTEVPFVLDLNRNVSYISFSGYSKSITKIYDLSTYTNYKKIKLSISNFIYNNQIPLLVSPETNVEVSLFSQTGSLTIPSPNLLGENKTAIYESINAVGNLPVFNGKGSGYSYASNQITGTIDPSWCNTNLFVSFNNLTGSIPSCFACYFKSDIYTTFPLSAPTDSFSYLGYPMYTRFSNNSFTNYNQNIPCTTYKPYIRLYNSTTMIISGQDIGYEPGHFYFNYSSTIKCINLSKSFLRLGYEYFCNLNMDISTTRYLPVQNIGNGITLMLPLKSGSPTIGAIFTTSNDQVYFNGTYFSSYIGQYEQNVTIGGSDCQVSSTNFLNITCTTTTTLSTIRKLVVIKNNGATKKVYAVINNSFVNNMQCPNNCINDPNGSICDMSTGKCAGCPYNCSGNGVCNELEGKCECYPSFQSSDCSIPVLSCPNNCTGPLNGLCNNRTGECVCSSSFQSSDCSVPVVECIANCSNHGACNNVTGSCTCDIGFQGSICEIIEHYVTSVLPSNENGGEASFIGEFGDRHEQLMVKIGDGICDVTFNSSTMINCTALPGKGIYSINITQNNIVYIGLNIYKYIELEKETIPCPNNCSNHGTCDESTGVCKCDEDYSSFDCNSFSEGSTPGSGVDNNTGGVDIHNEKVNFNIYLRALNEIDIHGNIVNNYSLIKDWTVNKTESNIYQFEQSPNNDDFKVISVIEQVNQDKQYSFAGVDFLLEKNSIKFTITVQNYKYQSYLNTLQLEMVSNVTQKNNEDTDCNSNDTKLDSNSFSDSNTISYIKLTKNNVDFVGRFINKVVSDSKPTFLSSTLRNESNDQIIVTLNLPHCVKECIIDPDFGALLNSDFSDCKSPNENIKWKIPVAIVVGVVGAACIGILIYKRKNIIKVNGKKINLSEMNKLS